MANQDQALAKIKKCFEELRSNINKQDTEEDKRNVEVEVEGSIDETRNVSIEEN